MKKTMAHGEGTSKNLEEALKRALAVSKECANTSEQVEVFKAYLQDFMAQRFGVAVVKAQDKTTQDAILELYKAIGLGES